MMDAAQHLIEEGYTHGYGDFWDVRVMQERTNGALTFAALSTVETEEKANVPMALTVARWLEMDQASDLDACEGKTFLLLSHDRARLLEAWIQMAGAPVVFENGTYKVYGFDSSASLMMRMQEGKMTLENAQRQEDGSYLLGENGKLRMPPDWREAGSYALRLHAEGEMAPDSLIRVYAGRNFENIAEQVILEGENQVPFTLDYNEKYLMIQVLSGASDELTVCDFTLKKIQ